MLLEEVPRRYIEACLVHDMFEKHGPSCNVGNRERLRRYWRQKLACLMELVACIYV